VEGHTCETENPRGFLAKRAAHRRFDRYASRLTRSDPPDRDRAAGGGSGGHGGAQEAAHGGERRRTRRRRSESSYRARFDTGFGPGRRC
jgi:hypothetical protein